ncbi:MAG TPA: c-type cytochrome, partial [Burkholderiales bacterium]|nr:c-type cytochrome [Burkholderiales bacterium]
MNPSWTMRIAAALLLLVATQAGLAAGDAKRGAQIFRQCMACHSTEEGEHMTGPSLAHAWRRKAGTVEGFVRYSEPMKRSNVTWDDATLDRWLADPERFIPGTTMTFAGLKQPRDRQDVVAYLRALAEQSAPQSARGGKADLRKAPPQAQV